MICRQCGKEFDAEIPTKKFCSRKCYFRNMVERRNTGAPPADGEPFTFVCGYCGKTVFNDGRGDKRFVWCSKRCHDRAKEQRKEQRKRHRGDNLGVSSGMSLGSLIRREKRSLD